MSWTPHSMSPSPPTARSSGRAWAAPAMVVAASLLAGCEGGTAGAPYRGPARAVENPYARASGNDEVFSARSGATPLLTVEFPNTLQEEPRVVTIVDSLTAMRDAGAGRSAATRAAAPAATQPSTQPATGPATPAGAAPATADLVRVVAQQRPADSFACAVDDQGTLDLRITSSTGIGSVTLERAGENWPGIIRVDLFYADGRHFTRLEGFSAKEVSADGRTLELRTTVEKEKGTAQVTVPAFSRASRIDIWWVDAYR